MDYFGWNPYVRVTARRQQGAHRLAKLSSCPDWAWMCKHVAAVLYGIGARLDERPELLFLLRRVDQRDLIAKADSGLRPASKEPTAAKVLDGDLSQMFGIEIAQSEPASESATRRKRIARDSAAPSTRARTAGSAAAGKKPVPSARSAPHTQSHEPRHASRRCLLRNALLFPRA